MNAIAEMIDVVAESVLALQPRIAQLGPDGCRRLGRALAAAFPELCLAVTGDGGGRRGTEGDVPPSNTGTRPRPPLDDRSASSSSDPLKNPDQSLSPLLWIGRAREGDEGDGRGRVPLRVGDARGTDGDASPCAWERDTRDLLRIGSESEWGALRTSVRREIEAAVSRARRESLVRAEIDIEHLETAVVAAARERARGKLESGSVDAPQAYFLAVVHNTTGSVLRDRATRAARKRRERQEEARRRRSDETLERISISAPPEARASVAALKSGPQRARA